MTDITDLTDAELDALLGMDEEDVYEEAARVRAEAKAARNAYEAANTRRHGYCRRGPNSPR